MAYTYYVRVSAKYQLGYAGVGFFYLLSGFILTYVYFHSLSSGSKTAIKKFYIARIAKIYPVHVLTLIASIPLFLGTVQALFPDHTKFHFLELLGVNLSLTQSYFPTNMVNFSFNGVAWSISVEMFFYALFPVIVYVLGRYATKLSVGRLVILAVTVWCILVVSIAPIGSFIDDWRLYIFPPVRLPEFIIGMVFGLIYLKRQELTVRKVASRWVATWFEAGAIILLLIGIAVSPSLPQSLHFAAWLIPFWALIIFIFSQQRGYLSWALSRRWLVYLGEISFSFYMVHQLVIRYVTFLSLPKIMMTVMSLALAVTLSGLIYYFYEEPSRVRVKKWLERLFIYRRRTQNDMQPELDVA